MNPITEDRLKTVFSVGA